MQSAALLQGRVVIVTGGSHSIRNQIISVLIVLLLTLPLHHAWAQCAWVLWEHIETLLPDPKLMLLNTKEWKLHYATQTKTECEAVLFHTWQAVLKLSQPGPDKPGIKETQSAPALVIVKYKEGGGTSYQYYCIPDTIDPRGPGGSKK